MANNYDSDLDFSNMYKYTGYEEAGKPTRTISPQRPSGRELQTSSKWDFIPKIDPITRTTIAPPPELPEFGAAPGFEMPEYKESEVRKLTHRAAAPGVRNLRQAVQTAMSRSYENPNVRRMTLRQALAGYGLGLEGVMAGAAQQARGEYGEKYGREFQGAQIGHEAEMETYRGRQRELMTRYASAMQQYESDKRLLFQATADARR